MDVHSFFIKTISGFKSGKKSSIVKISEQSDDKSMPQAKKFLGFPKYFS